MMTGTIDVFTNLANVNLKATDMFMAVIVSYFSNREKVLTTLYKTVLMIMMTREANIERVLIAELGI